MKKASAVLVAISIAGILACGTLAVSLRAQQQRQPPKKAPGTIRVKVELVDILASVIDANGKPIPDLDQSAFELSEEGVPQKIERFEAQTSRPLDIALMVDASMSTFKDLKFENEAAARFIAQIVRPSDTLGVFEFSDGVTQLSNFTSDIPSLQAAVRKIAPGAGTPMYDAIVLGARALQRRPEQRRRAIVLVTDAGETTSGYKFEDARRAAIAAETLLYSIVIRPVKNESGRNTAGEHALITITDSAGGNQFVLDDLAQLDAMYDRINRELRTQYLLGYYPDPAPPVGTTRHVELKVKQGYIVRHRSEYFVTGGD